MKRLLSTSAAFALALAPVQPWPLYAQTLAEDGSVIAPDGTVLCAPTVDAACDLDAITAALAATAAEAAAAAAAAAEQAAQAEAAAAAEQAAQAEAAAAEQAAQAEAAAAEQAAQAEAAAAAEQAAQAEAAAAEQAAQDEAAAAAEQAAQDEAAAEQAAQAEAAAAAEQAAQDEAAAAAEQAAQDEATAAEEAAKAATDAAEAAAELPAEDVPPVDEVATPTDAPAVVEAPAAEAATETTEVAPTEAAPNEAAPAEDTVATEVAPEAAPEVLVTEAPAAEADPVDVPVVSEEAATSLADILTAPAPAETEVARDGTASADTTVEEPASAVPVAAAADAAAFLANDAETDPTQTAETNPELAPVTVQTDVITEDNTRTSDQEFVAAPVEVAAGKKSGLSDLEKVGLLALGALVVGSIINEGKKDQRKVVSNTGDRVVVENADGTYEVYKDDDAILRRPGVRTVTETYRDGSTRTVVQRANGTEVVTIRDASGRVLRRATYDTSGNEIILIDDLAPEERIDITKLPKPKPGRVTISTSEGDAALKAEMAALEAESLGRKFSLRQIRDIAQVRALAAMIEVDSITFDSGSAAINATEARKLADIGRIIEQLLAANPAEVFLIEGHTDAVGSAVSNLSLSDRRAESLALALTEYFGIPPENLVVQGYGESELKVESLKDERANRRVVVRLVTPLMRVSELR